MARPAKATPERNRLIAELLTAGYTRADVALISGLTVRQVSRIREDAEGEAPPPRLTPHELRGIRRDFGRCVESRHSPEALEWLASQQTDRRRASGSSRRP